MSNLQPSNKKTSSGPRPQSSSQLKEGEDSLSRLQDTNQYETLNLMDLSLQPQDRAFNQSNTYNFEDSIHPLMLQKSQQFDKNNYQKQFNSKIESKQIGDNNLGWVEFVYSINQENKPTDFLEALYNKIESLGHFSPQIPTLIINNFPKNNAKRIIKSYEKIMLDPVIEPFLKELAISSMKDDQKKQLYKSIGEGSQNGIIKVLEQFVDMEDVKVSLIIQDILKLYKKPIMILENVQEDIQNNQNQNQKETINTHQNQETERMMAILKKETQDFTKYLQENKASLQNSDIEQIMAIKFNHGRFSHEIDNFINNHPKIKKHIKRKVRQCFEDLFRDFQLSIEIMTKFQQLDFKGEDVKLIKNSIRQNNSEKITQILGTYLDEDDQISQLTKKILSQRPKQITQQKLQLKFEPSLVSIQSYPKKKQSQNKIIEGKQKQTLTIRENKDLNKEKKQPQQKQKQASTEEKKEIEEKEMKQNENNQPRLKLEKIDEKQGGWSTTVDSQRDGSYQQSQHHQHKLQRQQNGQIKKNKKSKIQEDFPTADAAHRQSNNNTEFPQFRKDHYNKVDESSSSSGPYNHSRIPFHQQPDYQGSQTTQSRIQQFNRGGYNGYVNDANLNQGYSNTRYLLVVKEKGSKFKIYCNNDQDPLQFKDIVVDKWQRGNLQGFVYRLNLSPNIQYYSIQPQKGKIRTFFGGKEQIVLGKKTLEKQFLSKILLIDRQEMQNHELEIMNFYSMCVLNEYSKKRQYDSFWNTLKYLQSYYQYKRKPIVNCLCLIPSLYQTKKFRFSSECSRILLYFLFQFLHESLNPFNFEDQCLQSVSYFIDIEDYSKRLPYFNRYYTFEIQTKLILNCLINRYSKNLPFNDKVFQRNFSIVFTQIQNFQAKLEFIKSFKKVLQGKIGQLYPLIKDSINIYQSSIFQYLALRLTLINIHKPQHNYNSNLLQQNKRFWVVYMIQQVKNLVFNLNQNQLNFQKQQLQKLCHFENEIEQILRGKGGNNYNYFLFQNELFYQFYNDLLLLRDEKDFNLYQYFFKFCDNHLKNKSIEHVILKTQKSASMISLMCSRDLQQQKNLLTILKKITNQKINLLEVIKLWFGLHFKKQNNNFFIKVFLQLMASVKNFEIEPLEFLQALQPYHEEKGKVQHVQLFERSVIQKMKRFCQLPELEEHLLHLNGITKPIRQIYIEQLSVRLEQVKHPLKKLQESATLIISNSNINKEDREILLRKLFQNRDDKDASSLKKQIIHYYSQGKKQLRALGYYSNFTKTLKQIVKQFQQREVTYVTIEQIKKAKIRITTEANLDDFMKLCEHVQTIYKEVEQLKKKNVSFIKAMKEYDGLFKQQIEELQEWNRQLPLKSVRQSLRNIKRFNEFLDYSVEINSLMKIPLWRKQEIKSLRDLLTMRKDTIQKYGKLIESFESNQLTFNEFRKYFKVDLLATLLENIKDKDGKFVEKLTDYVNYLDEKTLKNYQVVVIAINKVSTDIEKSQYFDKETLQIIAFLLQPIKQISIEQAYKKIQRIDKTFKRLKFDILNESEEILKTLVFKNKYKRVFEMIEERKIDSQTVLNDLKEYINDVENSILKIQDIKELQNVVLFHEMQKNAKGFEKFIDDLRKQVSNKKLQLSENIFNVDSKLKQIQQMIDSSANRQTSFKYDLQEIFKYSVVKIMKINGFAHVEIQTNQKNEKNPSQKQIMTQKATEIKDKNQTFTFKKLTQFKDKAILLVSDFQKSTQNQEIMQQTIDLLKEFLGLYKILEEIQIVLEKAVIYGYNPEDLNEQGIIKNNDYKKIVEMKLSMEKISNQWIEGMKQIYENSYLLTHFMGPRLNAFINDTLSFKFSPLIKKIIDLDQKQFAKQMDSLRFIGLDLQNSTQIKKVKEICRIFHKIQQKTLTRFEQRKSFEFQNNKNQIELITCNSVQNYYYALVKGNAKPEMNQILYLQKQTSFQEIEVFIKRAIIKYQRIHYFIGVHYLPAQVQLKFIDLLNDYVRTQERRNKFSKCKLCFIDNSPTEKVYLHLSKKNLFHAKLITDTHLKTSQETKFVLNNIGEAYLVQSKIAGLGKTYWAQHKKLNSNIVYFSIAGHVHFSRLLQRLKAKNFVQDKPNTLILQIGHVENKNKLQIFLFQMIFFKGFNFKQFFFLPKDTTVIIEMENTYETVDKYQYYSILKIIKQKKDKYFYIEDFNLETLEPNFSNIQEAFTFFYLVQINLKNVLKNQTSFMDFEKQFSGSNLKICSKQDARKLIKFYFLDQLKKSNTQPTFWLYQSFIKLLFVAFKTFSQNGCFNIYVLESNSRANRSLSLENVRLDFLNCCIKNCIQFLQATINTNEFNEAKEEQNKIGKQNDFRSSLSKFPFLIMPAYDFLNYQFVYLNSQQVNVSIKSLIVSQTIPKYIKYNKHKYDQNILKRRLDPKIVQDLFSEDALQNLKGEEQQRQFFNILYILSNNPLFNIPENKTIKQFKNENENVKNYSLTLDNFFKMCLILQRAVAHIPIIIMGESGVGKTALIKFLVEVVFQQRFLIFNIHAGIDQEKLVAYYQQIKQVSEQIKDSPRQKVWVFFDEFNTSDELSYIKEMIIDRKFQGESIPQNFILIGACNPYRKKKESNFKRAGIKKKVLEKSNQGSSDLAFRVKPPPLSMIQFMWDYQQLKFKQNLSYISKILQNLELTNHQTVTLTISEIHEIFKQTYEISSVSLRDVTRFKQLYLWFRTHMPKSQDVMQNGKQNPNYSLNEEIRAIALSISFCYSLRVADRQQRKQLLKKMTVLLKFQVSIQLIVQNEQIDYVQRLKLSNQRIAINFSLRQNVFTTLVCIMNKIPILIIGNPGNSKSLSVKMISSNLRGLNSESEFCRKFPELSIIYFQGSEACTSKGVEAVFQKAIRSNNDFKKKKQKQPGLGQVQNCVLFDEIGLAEKSIHNPLKVLHSNLQTDQKKICFIGISNWELDAAKMSRFLVLSRSNPEKEELKDTAVKILQTYLKRQALKYQKVFKEMSDWYYDFVEQWDKENKGNQRQGFFGLRDFYCYLKDVAAELQAQLNSKAQSVLNLDDIIRKAIRSNFDGQEQSVEMFLKVSGLSQIQKQYIIDPIKLVQENLTKQNSRCLLLIVKGDALLPIINSKLKKNGQKRRIDCIYGSTFSSDQQSQEYNLEITSIIISHMSRGTLLTFKNPNNSIQTSLYDVFNKSFTQSGNKKYCRVAVGANSNPKCVVHKSFGSIVFIDQQIIKNTDLAFLNRFQKHFLTLTNVISNFQKQFVNEIVGWINNLLNFKAKTNFKKQQQYLINSSQESIVTLVLRYRDLFDIDKQRGINKIKKALLKNATQHFFIALKDQKKNYIPAVIKAQVNKLLQEIENEKTINRIPIKDDLSFGYTIKSDQQLPQNKIIFTYDQNIYSSTDYMFCSQGTLKIRISEVKSERQLRKLLKDGFASQSVNNIHILIDFQNQFYHLNFVAFLITGLKEEVKSDKTIFIIIKLSQNSLETVGRDHINISYLLDFEQRYIGSLTKGMNFIETIEQKTIKELYIEKKMQQNFDNYYQEAMARFRLFLNQKNVLKKIPSEEIKQFQFEQIMKMNSNLIFRTQAMNFIYENLSDAKIDISIILNNKQDRNLCSSPQESFEKYLQNCIIQTICTFFDRAYRNCLFFTFDLPALFKFLNNYYDVKLLEKIYQISEQNYGLFLSQLVNIFVKDKSLTTKTYLKKYGSNPLEISPMCLLPMGHIELSYISSSNQDSLFKQASKILQLLKNSDTEALQGCQISIQKCLSILNDKSVFLKVKKGDFDFQTFLNKNPYLQTFYFFDLISKIYSESIESNEGSTEIRDFPLAKIVYLFVQIFQKLQMKEKVLLLSLSKQLWSSIFNLWILWITYDQSTEFHRQIESEYLKNQVIKNQENQPHKLPELLKQLCQTTMSLQQKLLGIDKILGMGMPKYLKFFRATYSYTQKIRLICMDLDVETSQNLRATKRFFDLMEQIFEKSEFQVQLAIFLTGQIIQFEPKVERYLSMVLKEENKSQAQIEHILTYLSLEIYGMWIQKLNKSKGNGLSNQQTKHCIESFINYSNQYSLFANNSSFFLQNLFVDIVSEDNTIAQNMESIELQESDVINIINKDLSLDSNFAVALGNYFLEDFRNKSQKQEYKMEQGMNEENSDCFLEKYFDLFEKFIKRNSHPNKVFEIYITEFLKYYCLRYLDAVEEEQSQTVTWKIDQLLNQQTQMADTLRLYLLKNILYRNQKMTSVRDNYLQNKKFKWLEHFRTLVCGKTFQILVPPPFQEEQKKLTELIQKYRDSQYEKIQIFTDIIEESFPSPITKYEFLTFVMNDIYTRSCSEDKIQNMLRIVQEHGRYKDPTNSVELNLLNCYFNHKITQNLKYQQRQMETQQAKIQEFVRNQLVFINYLNIFVACSKSECPLVEMFFDMNGNVPERYFDWIQERFLVNGRENQSVSILKRFIQLGDNTPGYYKCSRQCDMFYTIGGSGGFGCQLPRVEGTCGWCKKIIGGTNHNLTRANEGARKVDLTQLPRELQIIRQKKSLHVLNHKLNGYSYSFNLDDIKKQVVSNKRLPESAKYILQQMIFSVWSFLASTNQIVQNDVKEIFHMNLRAFEEQSFEVMRQFYKMETKTLNLNEEDQSDLVWHLGMSKQIMKFVIEYKTKLSHELKQKMGLIRCVGRDMFEQYLVDSVVLRHSSGNQKLSLINSSRCVRAGVNLSGQQISRQTAGYQEQLDRYPKIRLIKVLYEDKAPSFQNLVEEYREKINRDYRILSYFIEHQEQIEKLTKYRKLYQFISKILKMFNLKITRQQAKQKSLLKLYQQLCKTNKEDFVQQQNSFRQELIEFCQIWNELRKQKFDLRYNCHSFGLMNEVTILLQTSSPAVNFFPDIKYKGHQKGEMILSLLQVTAQQYNNVCRQINHAKMGSRKYRQIQIFNFKPVNPTQIYDFTKTLELTRELIEGSYISNYSNWSVEYGCGLPHYSIDRIESLMVQHIVGCHIINEQLKEFDTINFIGEQLDFIVQIRDLQNQREWDSIPRKQEIQKFIYNIKHNEPDSFFKEINLIKGSIELILHYFRLKKGINIKNKTIQDFIKENKIYITSKTLMNQPLLLSIQLQYILAFYEFIELHTLKDAAESLDETYKKEKLSQMQIRNLNMFLSELKKEYKAQEEINYHLSIALYRLVARSLLLVQKKESLSLFNEIYGSYSLWPHNFDHERLERVKYFRQAFDITLTKMQSLLDLIPFELKKTKTEVIMIDRKQNQLEAKKKVKEPEKLKATGAAKGKKKNI